ncbi:MAG TPA: cysteine synthase [Candidatus Kapabacteria bacterium]|jgi:cystathionine beta-synthase|nr:cysteine synthase [Candidatus Kapabacteria bacterium]
MKKYSTILDLIGKTPLVELQHLNKGIQAKVLLKLESMNPGGSVKDRIGVAMIEAAEKDGKIKKGDTIIEPTSGNTGIGLALAARLKGYKCLFVMTDKASQERVRYLKALGADVLIVSSAAKASSPEYYFNTAMRLASEIPNAIMLNQYDNPANPGIHEMTTGPEIWEDTDGMVTHFIAGIGTGGTISGTARYLKSKNPNIKIIAADPIGSSIKTFKETGRLVEALPYLVEGVGQERIPGNLDLSLVDEIINVSDKESFMTARRLGLEEGIFCGGSSGMNVAAALRVAKLLPENAVVVAIICDTGERYLTKHHSDEWLSEKKLLDVEKVMVKNVIDAKIRKSLTPAIISATSEMTIGECLTLMSSHEISEIPVIDNGKMVGSVRENKLMGKLLQERESNILPVSEIMEEPMPILKADEDIQSGIQQLKEYPAIAVEEFGRIIGVITRHDVIEYI